MLLRLIAPALASLVLCVLAIVALRPIAIAIDLIDRPGGRKTHHGNIPIVGGLAMYMGLVLGLGVFSIPDPAGGVFLSASTVLVTIGLLDDRFDLSPWARLPVQLSAALILVFGAGATVTGVGDPFGTGPLTFGSVGSVVFTVLMIVAAINAFNMLDGMDGLAGATALTTFVAFGVVAGIRGDMNVAGVSLILAGSVCGFLIFNLPTHLNRPLRCFMGDAGSTLLGFSVAWLCIRVSQGSTRSVTPVTTLWIVAMPLYELFWTTLRRLIRGTSPFRPDADHFHHMLLKAGFGVRGAFAVFVTLAVILAGVGLTIESLGVSEASSFLLLIVGGVAMVRLMYSAELLWALVPESLRRLPPLEASAAKIPAAARDRKD